MFVCTQGPDDYPTTAIEAPSFAVGVVTSDRKPGNIFLGSEPASGVLGCGENCNTIQHTQHTATRCKTFSWSEPASSVLGSR